MAFDDNSFPWALVTAVPLDMFVSADPAEDFLGFLAVPLGLSILFNFAVAFLRSFPAVPPDPAEDFLDFFAAVALGSYLPAEFSEEFLPSFGPIRLASSVSVDFAGEFLPSFRVFVTFTMTSAEFTEYFSCVVKPVTSCCKPLSKPPVGPAMLMLRATLDSADPVTGGNWLTTTNADISEVKETEYK